MKAIKYTWSGDHKTVIDIGNNDIIICIAINMAIEKYKKVSECFVILTTKIISMTL